ncbi:MAG TPA: preprotein translocase subunit YajC [Patescibacteria group bacterium]|nr:preprotein translocase subunit YajC [Patescibacteria group bacterium]
MFISQAFAQAAGGPAAGGLAGMEQFLPLVLIFVVFYFLLLRPQQQKIKQHKELVAQLRRGDRVVTQGGFIGTINKVVSDTEVIVEIAEGVRVRVVRSAIAEVVSKTEPVAGAAKDEPEAKAEGEPAKVEDKASMLGKLFGKK